MQNWAPAQPALAVGAPTLLLAPVDNGADASPRGRGFLWTLSCLETRDYKVIRRGLEGKMHPAPEGFPARLGRWASSPETYRTKQASRGRDQSSD